jgi:regulatory protein
VDGEHPPARRRSARRTRGGPAATEPDLADLEPDRYGLAPAGDEPAEPQLAWSDEWTERDSEERREERAGRGHGVRERDGREHRGRGRDGRGQEKEREPDDPESRARQICLQQLSLAPRTRAQLREALAKREIPEDAADAVLGRFADVGLIDDAAFARAWVESRHYSKGLAGRALKAELRRRGVEDDDIKEAVATLGPDAEAESARRLVDRRLAGMRGQPAATRARRLAGMLARKGYPAGLAFRVIREALEAEAPETGEAPDGLAFDEMQSSPGGTAPRTPRRMPDEEAKISDMHAFLSEELPIDSDSGNISRVWNELDLLRKANFSTCSPIMLAQIVINA